VAIGVRAEDEALCDRLNIAPVRRWDQIQAILKSMACRRSPCPKPCWRSISRQLPWPNP